MAYDATVKVMLGALERNLLPDVVIRKLTRLLLSSRLRWGYKPTAEQQLSELLLFVRCLKQMPIAVETDKPKSQHYELPTSFFKLVLGENMKYSCCYFRNNSDTLEEAERAMLDIYCERAEIKDGQTILDIGCGWGSFSVYIAQKYSNCRVTGICNSTTQKESIEERCSCCYFRNNSDTLEEAERAMLDIYCERAEIKDGQTILDIGCGWGSFSVYIAQKYSNCRVTGICNSTTQKESIEERCRNLKLSNVEIVAEDISIFEVDATFDRIISVAMFEHIKNYRELLKKISKWMNQESLLFIHYFCHKTFAYHFEDKNDDDWITRYFFTGGTMPSADLLLYFQDDVSIVNHWLVNGKHYAQTSEEWLKRMDGNAAKVKAIMESTYGKDCATKWTVYWRTFFLSVAELFGYNNGEEWMVSHFLFKKK